MKLPKRTELWQNRTDGRLIARMDTRRACGYLADKIREGTYNKREGRWIAMMLRDVLRRMNWE